MQKIRILIVEDELVIAEGLKATLQGLGYEVTGVFMSGPEILEHFRPGMADIVFMDIYLAGGTSGVDTAIALMKISDIPVIYMTNSQDDYMRRKAIHETNAVHYLIKPFSKADICTAIDFALKQLKTYKFEGLGGEEDAYWLKDGIFLKNGMGFKKIMLSEIVFLEADGSYCKFTFKDGKYQVFSENLSYFGEKLAFAKELVRVHRSYIVNINFIDRVHENRVWIAGLEIPIGRSYKRELLDKFRFV